jgi:hypothetical protein
MKFQSDAMARWRGAAVLLALLGGMSSELAEARCYRVSRATPSAPVSMRLLSVIRVAGSVSAGKSGFKQFPGT